MLHFVQQIWIMAEIMREILYYLQDCAEQVEPVNILRQQQRKETTTYCSED